MEKSGGSGRAVDPGGEGSAFRRYSKDEGRSAGTGQSEVRSHKTQLVTRLTKGIVETYQLCNPKFKHSEALNPKRYLTSPHVGVSNDGFDNTNSDLILNVNFMLINGRSQHRYIVKELLGQGTFGQVAKCWVPEENGYIALKIIKNLPAYYNQAIHEVTILRTLNENFDRDNKHHIVRMLEFFLYRRHLCISFEMLGINLYDLLKSNNLKGLHLSHVQMFSNQIMCTLLVLKDAGIIHCDLKPENILLLGGLKSTGVKVIDFGSACTEGHTVYSYIQSRYYRSPEVLLGYPYTTAIDMWSFGCIVVELFLGLPLFAGSSEYDLLRRMINVLGAQPPDSILRDAKKTSNFFKHVGSIHRMETFHGNKFVYHFLTEEESNARHQTKPSIGKWYFNQVELDDIILGYPYRKNMTKEEKSKEQSIRLALINFVRGLIEFDPKKRWTPLQASRHPFLTGEPFTQPYCPPPVTYNTPIPTNVRVNHGPERGHWLASGLSPQVSHMNLSVQHSSPCIQMMPFSHASSGYGSCESYGSFNDNPYLVGSYGSNYNENPCLAGSYGSNYNDNPCLFGSYGSSYNGSPCFVGSHGDKPKVHDYCSTIGSSGLSIPMHKGGLSLGTSPDLRCVSQYSHGTFRPMSLGASPSQFTPPNISPRKYSPTSPANLHGSLLGKATGVGPCHKKSWGYSRNIPQKQHFDGASQHRQLHHLEGSYSEQNYQGCIYSPHSTQSTQSNWRNERCGNEYPSGMALNSPMSTSQMECGFSSSLDPGNWDPNYSDDLLLQDDDMNIGNLVSGIDSIPLAPEMDSRVLNIGTFRHKRDDIQVARPISSSASNTRKDKHVQSVQKLQSIVFGSETQHEADKLSLQLLP